MTVQEMNELAKEFGLKDNPFDVMMYHSLELSREVLFMSRRMRTENDRFCPNLNRVERIKEQYDIIKQLPDEMVRRLAEASHYYPNPSFGMMNELLLKKNHELSTVFTRINPCHNDTVEEIIYGKDSKEMARLNRLKEIADEFIKMGFAKDDFFRLCDVITDPECAKTHFFTSEEEFEKYCGIINQYQLTDKEIGYMVSYKFRE